MKTAQQERLVIEQEAWLRSSDLSQSHSTQPEDTEREPTATTALDRKEKPISLPYLSDSLWQDWSDLKNNSIW